MTTVPSAAAVATRLGKTPESVAAAYAAEVTDQANRCRVVPYTDALAEALHRRVARSLAMRSLPLGVQTDELGSIRVGSTDPEVRRLEGPYRRLAVG